MTGPDCAVIMCNLVNKHNTHVYTHAMGVACIDYNNDFYCSSYYLKKNQTTPRPSEHPPVMGEKNVKTFRWDQKAADTKPLMAFKQIPRCR